MLHTVRRNMHVEIIVEQKMKCIRLISADCPGKNVEKYSRGLLPKEGREVEGGGQLIRLKHSTQLFNL